MQRENLPSPGPWEYIPSNENHGPYVVNVYGSDVCDCYAMSDPRALAVCNGGDSKPIHFRDADANARVIAAAPDMLATLKDIRDFLKRSGYDTRLVHSVITKAEGST